VTELVLVDTSIWVEHLRDRSPSASDRLADLLGHRERRTLCMCEPVALELLAGASDHQLRAVQSLVDGLETLSLDPAVDFRAAAGLQRRARTAGLTVRSSIDLLIAAVALRHDAVVVHRDRNYDVLSRVCGLRAERWE
jgi:predicted nucleic acid-binding protein